MDAPGGTAERGWMGASWHLTPISIPFFFDPIRVDADAHTTADRALGTGAINVGRNHS